MWPTVFCSVFMSAHIKNETEGRGLTAQVRSHLLFRIQKQQKCLSLSCDSSTLAASQRMRHMKMGHWGTVVSSAGTALRHPDLTLPRHLGHCGAGAHAALLNSFPAIAGSKHKEAKSLEEKTSRNSRDRVFRKLWSACSSSQLTPVRIWSIT